MSLHFRNLFPDRADVHVDRSIVDRFFRVMPNGIDDVLAAHCFARHRGQAAKDIELCESEIDHLALEFHCAAGWIDAQVAHLNGVSAIATAV